MASRRGFRIQHIAVTPRGWHVRTVRAGAHDVRIAFPPGRRKTGDGKVVEILHPKHENPMGCRYERNPAELLLMGANPLGASPYDKLSVRERLAFGRLGLGKKQLQTEDDIARARELVESTHALRNRLPNPECDLDDPRGADARAFYDDFHATPSTQCHVADEPHMPAGDYTDLGKLIALRVKPTSTGSAAPYVQEISFPGKHIRLVSDPRGKQLYLVGSGQDLDPNEIALFTSAQGDSLELGECRSIVYGAKKFHEAVPESARGKYVEWEHTFGDEGGRPPILHYDRALARFHFTGGTYHVEGVGIVN